jgi:hypothetical protein
VSSLGNKTLTCNNQSAASESKQPASGLGGLSSTRSASLARRYML